MLEILHLAGTPKEEGVPVYTRKKRQIRTYDAPEPDFRLRELDIKRLRDHRSTWEPRKPISGTYNCFGLVWASRRTAIDDVDRQATQWIKDDDQYRVLAEGERPERGDLAVYRWKIGSGSIFHVGVVMGFRMMGNERTTWVLSKWCDGSSEVVHNVNDVDWDIEIVSIEYWTDRPNDAA